MPTSKLKQSHGHAASLPANLSLPAAQLHFARFLGNLESRALLLKVETFNLGQYSTPLHYFMFSFFICC